MGSETTPHQKILSRAIYAGVEKLVYSADLKSAAARHAGSIPASGTNLKCIQKSAF